MKNALIPQNWCILMLLFNIFYFHTKGAFVNQTMLPVLWVMSLSEWFWWKTMVLVLSVQPFWRSNGSSIQSKTTTLARLNPCCVMSIHVKVTKSIYVKMLAIITLSVSARFQGITCKEAQFVAVCWADSGWYVLFCVTVKTFYLTGSYCPSMNGTTDAGVSLPESYDECSLCLSCDTRDLFRG